MAMAASSRPPRPFFFFLLLLLLCPLASASASLCTAPHPEDYSHRQESAKSWYLERTKRRTLGNWGLRSWSSLNKIKLPSAFSGDSSLEEFVQWSHRRPGGDNGAPRKFVLRSIETPWCPPGGLQKESFCHLGSFAANDMGEEETVAEFPLASCISDVLEAEDPKSLVEAPWEIRLATKLLRERARKASPWAPFFKLLPSYFPLPMFFSNLELNNIEDQYVIEEVYAMRKFAQSAYQVLHEDDIPGVKFNEFVWALAVVYSLACEVEISHGPVHLILPFFSSPGGEAQVSPDYLSGKVLLRTNGGVEEGMPLSLSSSMRSTAAELVFRGSVPKDNPHNEVCIFQDLKELVDWYVETDDSLNSNKYLTLTVVQDVIGAVKSELHLNRTQTESMDGFAIRADGSVNPHMLCTFAALSFAKNLIDLSSESQVGFDGVAIGDLAVREGIDWNSRLQGLAKECVALSASIPQGCHRFPSQERHVKDALLVAMAAIQGRLQFLLDSYPTSLREDYLMLAAASWEGYAGIGTSQACPTCRWQIEQLGQNDYLAVNFRTTKKLLLLQMVSQLSCGSSVSEDTELLSPPDDAKAESQNVQEFLSWCEEHNFTISKKLGIVDINVEGKREGITDENRKVRGVVAVEDISHGDTLSSLPLNMGLYDKESMHVLDGWDRAAARLLQERALGESSRWAPYIRALPSRVPTPINLKSNELHEVQWWPLLRELVQVRKSIKESYALLDDEVTAWSTLEEFRWAATIVHSRAFTLPVADDEEYAPYVLMPFMDMINHHYHYQADWSSEPAWHGKLDIVARRHMRKGEQLFASFGPRSNDNLFLYYGFVLEDNPWDTAQIFPSFEESVRWFLQLWSTSCIQELKSQPASNTCSGQQWHRIWPKVSQTLDSIGDGSSGQSKEWVHLINHWADFGFQFLPYSPSPSIYTRGIIDPSLLGALSAVAESTFTPTVVEDYSLGDISVALRTFFSCLRENKPVGSVAEWTRCTVQLVPVFSTSDPAQRPKLIAETSIAARCFQVLQSMPTTIEEDERLLEGDCVSGLDCESSHAKLLRLTTRYRYMKKLLLQGTINRLLGDSPSNLF